jgi:rubrerythrin
MDLTNPFYIKSSVLSENLRKFLPTKFDIIVEDLFYEYFVETIIGEYHVSHAYEILLNRFKNGYYHDYIDHLSDKDKQDIESYFLKMIGDETKHTLMFKEMFYKIYNKSIDIHDHLAELLDKENLFETLTRYYISECYLWVSFYKIYKETQSQEFVKNLHQLLVDEAQHNNAIRKIFYKINKTKQFDFDYFNQLVSSNRYFGLSHIRKTLRLPGTNSKQDQWWENIIFDNQWQQEFNEHFIKKCYQVVSIFDPEIDYESYKKLINFSH